MTNKTTPHLQLKLLLGVLATLSVVGCNEGANNQVTTESAEKLVDEHVVDEHVVGYQDKGRLVISEKDQTRLRIIDLDNQNNLADISTTHPVSYLQTSPDGRYVVAIQRNNHLVEFIDSGLWLQPHGDHMDVVDEIPSLLSYQLQTIKPTHYNVFDHQAALFADGNKESGENAAFYIFDDESIRNGSMQASHSYDYSLHGTLQIRGDYVLAAMISDLQAQTQPTYNMPDSVALFETHGEHFHQEQVFSEQCPDLHGSFQGENWTVFGCSDGVLAIEQQGNVFTAKKISNPTNFADGISIGNIKGNHHLNKFLGMSHSQQTFLIDPALGTINEIEWKSSPDVSMKANTFDAHQEQFIVLDSEGYLSLFNVASNYAESVRFKVLNIDITTPAADISYQLATAASESELYITDPVNNTIVVVDLKTHKVSSTIQLDFTPNKITWAGIKTPEAAHEH